MVPPPAVRIPRWLVAFDDHCESVDVSKNMVVVPIRATSTDKDDPMEGEGLTRGVLSTPELDDLNRETPSWDLHWREDHGVRHQS